MREYLETFFRRKWLFFLPFFAVLAVALAGGLYTSWVYEVQARLAVQPNPVLDQGGQQLSLPDTAVKDDYTRLSGLLQTDDFMKRVIASVPQLKAQADNSEDTNAVIGGLRKDLNAWTLSDNLINFRYRNRDPQVAQQVVSKTIDLFLAQRYADRVGAADQAIGFFTQQQADYQQQLQQAGSALSAWEASHPPAQRANLPESEQLQYQALRTAYETILDHQKYIGGELEKARFTKAKMESEQTSAYQVVDPPVVPQSPDLSFNRLLGLLLVGLAVAVGLGVSVVAIATWLGAGRRTADARSALPAWLTRMMTQEEQTA